MKKIRYSSTHSIKNKIPIYEKIQWNDITGNKNDFITFLDNLSISPEISEVAIENQPFPEATLFSTCAILRLPIRSEWSIPDCDYVTFLIFSDRLVTLHQSQVSLLVQLRIQYQKNTMDEDVQSIPTLVSYILDNLIDTNIRCFTRARLATEEFGEKVDLATVVIKEQDAVNVRRQVSQLLSQFEDQFYALTSLETQHTKKAFLSELYDTLKDSIEAQGHLVRSLTHLEMRLRDIQQFYQYLMERKTEQRLRQLTVLSTVYMPLTLITSIYGMNFENMPGIGWEYGYFVLLGLMCVISGVLIYFFYRKGWFQ